MGFKPLQLLSAVWPGRHKQWVKHYMTRVWREASKGTNYKWSPATCRQWFLEVRPCKHRVLTSSVCWGEHQVAKLSKLVKETH